KQPPPQLPPSGLPIVKKPRSLAQNLPEVVLDLIMLSLKGVEHKEEGLAKDERFNRDNRGSWEVDDDTNQLEEPYFGPTKTVERRHASRVCKSWRQAALSVMSCTETNKTYEGVVGYLFQQLHRQFRGLVDPNPHAVNFHLEGYGLGWDAEWLASKLAVQRVLLNPPIKTLRLLVIQTSTTNMMAILSVCRVLEHLTIGGLVFGRVDRSSSVVQAARQGLRTLKSLSMQLGITSIQFRKWLLESVGTALMKLELYNSEDPIRDRGARDEDKIKEPVKLPAQCTQLRCLIAWFVPNRVEVLGHSLRILVANDWRVKAVCQVIKTCASLEELYGRGWQGNVDYGSLYHAARGLPNLRHFGLKGLQHGVEDFKEFLSVVGPQLTGLRLAHKWVDASVLEEVAEKCENLEYVSIMDMDDVESEGREVSQGEPRQKGLWARL
ncbi:hypothetical protein HK097_011309, partial [Rhizophlyctis rosea]